MGRIRNAQTHTRIKVVPWWNKDGTAAKRDATANDMYRILTGTPNGKLPVEGMPARTVDGVVVYVKPFVKTPGRRTMQGLRVMAICQCLQHVPVGRLHQHKCKG